MALYHDAGIIRDADKSQEAIEFQTGKCRDQPEQVSCPDDLEGLRLEAVLVVEITEPEKGRGHDS